MINEKIASLIPPHTGNIWENIVIELFADESSSVSWESCGGPSYDERGGSIMSFDSLNELVEWLQSLKEQ